MLERINKTGDIKKLNLEEKEVLSKEIRNYILDVVSKNGGHLSSNLGAVELTMALHSVFDLEKDKLIFDVGHQCYTHKILTGRKEEFKTLRKLNGLSGFPKSNESSTDAFNTGHSATSISAALGMARARDLKHEDNYVIAVIGDGALTGGLAYEALNDAGASNTNMLVILNDNEMSISENVGGVNLLLSKLRTQKLYNKSNEKIKKILSEIPVIGTPIIKVFKKIKKSIKSLFISKMFFEDIGFTYLGPVDGHNLEMLENILESSKEIKGPILIHVLTKKGNGYKFAEDNPDLFHSTSPFDIKTGLPLKKKGPDYSKIFGECLIDLAKNNDKIVAITAAMKDGTGLSKFQELYPDRFFDVGIAEGHALTLAAGMAKDGLIPVVSIYSTFYQRAFDQIIHDIAIQNLPVIMCVDRAGLVGEDGETHQGLFDLAFFNIIPNLIIMASKDFEELKMMLEFGINLKRPVVIRYPKGSDASIKFKKHNKIVLNESEILKKGNDLTIIAIGKYVTLALKVANLLKEENIDVEVINARFLKPFPEKNIINSINKTKKVVTIEDGTINGGLGTKVKELIIDNNLNFIKFKSFAYPDEFIKQGSIKELEELYGITEENIINNIKKMI